MNILILLVATLFAQANEQYTQGHYAEAAQMYETILTTNPNAQVYYNLGNCYFKQGELSQSILAYERCLRLEPRMKDAKFNLAFAQNQIVDNIADTQAFFLKNWVEYVRNSLSEKTWTMMSIMLFILFLVGMLFFALSRIQGVRKGSFYGGVVALIISVISIANAGSLHRRDTLRQEAIITRGIVNAKAAPDRSGTELFTLHEGTKVTIHETIGDWGEIHVGNNVGWIQLNNVERI